VRRMAGRVNKAAASRRTPKGQGHRLKSVLPETTTLLRIGFTWELMDFTAVWCVLEEFGNGARP
jgi:hypothetical protein